MRHKAVVTAILALFFFIAAARSGVATDINFGWPSGTGWTTLPFKVAADKGFFEKEGLKVRMITFRGTNLMLAALLSGDLDYMTLLPFSAGAAARGAPVKIVGSITKSSAAAIIAKPEIDSIKALKGKKVGINSFGSSMDYSAYVALSKNGLDPNKDVALLTAGGGNADRLAALMSGSIDATVVSSPFEFIAEKQGLKTLLSMRQLGELVRIPITGVAVAQKKIDKDPDEIIRLLRALRASILMLQQQRDYGIALFEKALRLERPSAEKFYDLFREEYNPELALPDAVVNDLLAVGTFRSKEQDKTLYQASAVCDWTLAEKAKR
jgi:NitT/TauT family transport system substrate-binding protein